MMSPCNREDRLMPMKHNYATYKSHFGNWIIQFLNRPRHTKLVDCLDDCEAFSCLTDDIFYQILRLSDIALADNEGLKKARDILQRVEERDLYTCVLDAVLREVRLFSDFKMRWYCHTRGWFLLHKYTSVFLLKRLFFERVIKLNHFDSLILHLNMIFSWCLI